MTLELLIEKQSSIKSIIQEKINSVLKWFKDKIEEVNDIFHKIKEKVLNLYSETLDKGSTSKKVGKDIEIERNGKKEKIISKDESIANAVSKAKNYAKSDLTKVKKLGDSAISKCQKGIRTIMGIKDEDLETDMIVREIHVHKTTVIDILKTIATVASSINATCGAYRMLLVLI